MKSTRYSKKLNMIMLTIVRENQNNFCCRIQACLVMKMMLVSTVIITRFIKVYGLHSTSIGNIFDVYEVPHNDSMKRLGWVLLL